MKRLLLSCVMVALATLTFTSCIKKTFDSPPNVGASGDSLVTNLTLKQLSDIALEQGLNGSRQIVGDSVVSGIVVGDDRSGNLYKEIVIQDSTGGMTLLIDQNNLYATYPIGMRIYIKLKGLFIGTYAGLPELGYTQSPTGIAKIPSSLAPNYIVTGRFPNTIVPKHYLLSQLTNNSSTLNTLVTIDSVEFVTAYAGVTWAVPVTTAPTTTLTLEDCNNHNIVLYNSGYATFQPYLTPTGKGSATCIYTVYSTTTQTTAQLLMRDTTDFKFTGTRCDGTSGNAPIATITIDSLKKIYYAAVANKSDVYILPNNYKINCTITQTSAKGNVTAGNLVVQDGTFKGIDLYFGATAALPYVLGDSITVDLTGASISRYKPLTGSLEVKLTTASAAKIVKIASGVNVVPLVMTVGAIQTNYQTSDLEYVLVKILNPTISGGATYGTLALSLGDSTGSGLSFFDAYSTFATTPIPTTTPQSVTGVLATYNSAPELQLRDTTDVTP